MSNVIKEETAMQPSICATCAQPLHGAYCSHCGEKTLGKHDRRVINIFEEFIHSLTHADNKFLRSVKHLLTSPGFLTNEYLGGRRKRYSTPLSLFFIANLLYLFCAPVDTFNSRFDTVIEGQPYSQYLVPQVKAKMQHKQWTRTQLEDHYNESSSHEAKLLLIVFVFLLSFPTALLFISRKHYYYDYVVFSMEYFNFIMYGLMLLLPWLVILVALVVRSMRHGPPITLDLNSFFLYGILLIILWSYLTIAARRVFRRQWWLTIIKAAALTFCTIAAMFLYRFIAFEVIMFLL